MTGTDRVLAYVVANPGCTKAQVIEAMRPVNPNHTGIWLHRLQKARRITDRMGDSDHRGVGPYWPAPRSGAMTEIFAWVSTEPDGSERIIAVSVPNPDGSRLALPLAGDNLAGMRVLRHWAEQTQRETGWPVRLLRFSTRETVEEL